MQSIILHQLQIAVAWGFPSILATILILVDGNHLPPGKRNPSFQYGNAQAAIAVFLLVMCFIGKFFGNLGCDLFRLLNPDCVSGCLS